MAGLLDDKVAMVTGAGSGIGRATSLEMARNGAKVVVADVDEDGGRQTVDTIETAGGDAIFSSRVGRSTRGGPDADRPYRSERPRPGACEGLL